MLSTAQVRVAWIWGTFLVVPDRLCGWSTREYCLDHIPFALQGKFDEAGQLSEGFLAIHENVLGSDEKMFLRSSLFDFHVERRLCYVVKCIQGKYRDAEPLYERCHAIEEKILGPEHPDLVNTLINWAGLLIHNVRAVRRFSCDWLATRFHYHTLSHTPFLYIFLSRILSNSRASLVKPGN